MQNIKLPPLARQQCVAFFELILMWSEGTHIKIVLLSYFVGLKWSTSVLRL